jgi:four helix bundle protein
MKKEGGVSGQPQRILKRRFDFAVRVIKLCQFLDERPGVARVLMPQILRAGTSIVSNVEEAQAGQSRADFISKMSIALKEARETHIRLRLLAASEVVSSRRLGPILKEADEIMRILAAIIISTKRGSGPDNA